MWTNVRPIELAEALGALREKPPVRFTFVPSAETDFIRYFASDIEADLASLDARAYQYLAPSELSRCDVLIMTAHGSDLSAALGSAKERAKNALIAVWMWDNHLGHAENLQTALAADLVFPSHLYQSEYLLNRVSALGAHVPACSAQWGVKQVQELYRDNESRRLRNDKVLVNYVDYPFSWRSTLLGRIKIEVPEAEVILMPPDDRSRYFDKNEVERFREWLGYKATLVLPIHRDLSTRVFDALLAGQIPIVPTTLPDFDSVIPPEMQRRLGILRVPDFDISTIRSAARQAIEIFDDGGREGARKRHEYAVENHMLVNRIEKILTFMRQAPLTPEYFRYENTAPRRNEMCPCGSGKRFKNCHGSYAAS